MRQAFTLIELMLVVLIIGLIYGLSLGGLKQYGKVSNTHVTPLTLQTFLKGHGPGSELLCTEECNVCAIYRDGEKIDEVDPFIDAADTVHRFDHRYGSVSVTFAPRFDAQGVEVPVCFEYAYLPDGTFPRLMLQHRDHVYVYPSYFGEVSQFESVDEAVSAYRETLNEVYR